MMNKSTFTKALRIISSTIESLEENEIEQLVSGNGKLIFVASTTPEKNSTTISPNHESIIQKLNECKDRDDARQLLASIPNKEILATIAKLQKIHIVKNDRREDIENKLIEFDIGAKLRTEAIQSLNLKGGSNSS
jgi:hypothetical protein